MIVELVGLNLIWTLFTVVGILTLFGKKKDKKDEKTDNTSEGEYPGLASVNVPDPSELLQSPTTTSSSAPDPAPPPPNNMPAPYQPPPTPWASPAQGDEDSSLSELLQSLLKDLPSESSSEPSSSFSMQSDPDWVPPRSTPSSRTMVIVPGYKKSSDQEKPVPSTPAPIPTVSTPPAPVRSVRLPEPAEETPKPSFQPKFSLSPPVDKPTPSVKEDAPKPAFQPKLSTPSVVDKPAPPTPPTKQEAPKRPSPSKASQDFDHIFDLTQGSFDSPGLVVINGAAGSGKTTLCSGLAGSFLKQGNPCMFVTYGKAPSTLRDQMKKQNFDSSEAESSFRFLVIDGFSTQTDSFSFEPYYVEKPFDLDSIQDSLVRNSSMFVGEKMKILFDSMDQVVAKVPGQVFVKRLGEMLDKLKDSGVTLVVTIDLSEASKDVVKWLEDTAACVIDLDKDDSDPNGRELKVRKLNGSNSKVDAETFEVDSGRGLVFVK